MAPDPPAAPAPPYPRKRGEGWHEGLAVILYPAIDLKEGACVRLVRGEMASATVFNDDPAAQAR